MHGRSWRCSRWSYVTAAPNLALGGILESAPFVPVASALVALFDALVGLLIDGERKH
jgi:hypothetical protein